MFVQNQKSGQRTVIFEIHQFQCSQNRLRAGKFDYVINTNGYFFTHFRIINFRSFAGNRQIYDGSNTNGLRLHPGSGFTSNARPKITLTAESGEMLVRFVSDALHSNAGWQAEFSAGKLYCILYFNTQII